MKKIATIATTALLTLSLAACAGSQTTQTDSSAQPEEVAAASKVTADQYVGHWVSGRASLEISPEDEGYKCTIHWGGSVSEATEWYYSCTFDGTSLVDEGVGVKSLVVYDENGNITSSTDEFTDGAASFTIGDDGQLTWTDYKEYPEGGVLVFERAE